MNTMMNTTSLLNDTDDVVIFRVDGDLWEFPLSFFLQQERTPLLTRIIRRWTKERVDDLESQIFRALRGSSARDLIAQTLFAILGTIEWRPREDNEYTLMNCTLADITFEEYEGSYILAVQIVQHGEMSELIPLSSFLQQFIPLSPIAVPFLHS